MTLLLLASVALADDACTLRIEAEVPADGVVRFGVYQPSHAAHFPAGVEPGEFLRNGTATVRDGHAVAEVGELPPGTYAVSAFLDLDGDGVFDKNLFGAPQEPFRAHRGAHGEAEAAVSPAQNWTAMVPWFSGPGVVPWLPPWVAK
jgi:uncharacterized protein (DUF2141 family)